MWGIHQSKLRLWRGCTLNALSLALWEGSSSLGSALFFLILSPNRSKFGFKTAGECNLSLFCFKFRFVHFSITYGFICYLMWFFSQCVCGKIYLWFLQWLWFYFSSTSFVLLTWVLSFVFFLKNLVSDEFVHFFFSFWWKSSLFFFVRMISSWIYLIGLLCPMVSFRRVKVTVFSVFLFFFFICSFLFWSCKSSMRNDVWSDVGFWEWCFYVLLSRFMPSHFFHI